MADRVAEKLQLTPGDRVACVGHESGPHVHHLLQRLGPGDRLLYVDQSGDALGQSPPDDRLVRVGASAKELADSVDTAWPVVAPGYLDALLAGGIVDQLPPADWPRVISGLARLVGPGGRLLLVTPSAAVPALPAGATRRPEEQPDPRDIAWHLRVAGLTVAVDYQELPAEGDGDPLAVPERFAFVLGRRWDHPSR
ncbi:class I SAM-dependent methyltransferase [Frankia nepalensis]|uniref:Methyltransferase n=1 Tax=Frankia nepalensis TaxID=1836974 RepID=A0A937RFU4_9ACTN|nr:hypothetical protein [Frankia nepalensis]MBL7500790.1 hypothetical protein [Frankia nepalensis]MBL7512597.1 hypothetical protein [Frankia nepalensis]MBL7628210.1 hypothetical protein [Frankia nepalensis]